MTDDVPVSDILLEAAEYLCKLGTNLTLRSENLKEKRISKKKLNNTHAVQKAADKLLLICELSKKSLDNVEVGVKKILSVLVRAQGSNPTKPDSLKPEIVYHYVKDGTRKLRMSQKISLEHFKSVKVKAHNLPLSKLEKYPVYLECKLYRRRKRKENEARLKQTSQSKSSINLDKKVNDDIKGDEKEHNKRHSLEIKQERDKKSPSRRQSSCSQSEKQTEKEDLMRSISSSNSESKSKHDGSSDQTTESTEKSKDRHDKSQKKRDKYSSESKKKKHSRIVIDSSDEYSPEAQEDFSRNRGDKETKPKSAKPCPESKKKHSRILDSSDGESSSTKMESGIKRADENKNCSIAEDSSNKSEEVKGAINETSTDSVMTNQIAVGETCDENPVEEKTEIPSNIADKKSPETVDDSNNDDIHTHKKRKLSHRLESSEEEKQNEKEIKIEENGNETTAQRPLLKLVNLSKLLKPDVLADQLDKIDTKNKSLGGISDKTSILNKKEKELQERKMREQKFWDQKRKEVLAFKAREFSVSVCRLPEFTNDFLVTNKIKKITQEGKTIAMKNKEKSVSFLNSDNEENQVSGNDKESNDNVPLKLKKEGTPDMNKVKIALLDSDSDKDQNPVFSEAEKVKKSLLNDSDSDGDLSKQCSVPPSAQNSEKNDSNSVDQVDADVDQSTGMNNTDSLSKNMDMEKENSGQESQEQKRNVTEDTKATTNHESNTETSKKKDMTPDCSDKDQNPVFSEAEKVKKSLLNDSDSDGDLSKQCSVPPSAQNSEKNDSNSVDQVDADVDQSTGMNNTDSLSKNMDMEKENSGQESQEQKRNVTEDTKATTNHESNTETSKKKDMTPDCSGTEKTSPANSPITLKSKTKRKNMMESMHAKKMLLTYSSSSDTEDEKLKDALKEIKTSLLQGSDEEVIKKVKENHRKRLLASSSSDEDDVLVNIQKERRNKDSDKSGDLQTAPGDEESKEKNACSNSGQEDVKEEETSSSSKMGRNKTKPASSSQNSDTQDNDKDIDGLTNLKTLSSRRRVSTSTSQAEDTGTNTRSKTMPKVAAIKMADLLQAATESSGESAGEAEDVNLPPITLSGLNGDDPIDLGKEQLLDDSDASSAHNKSSDGTKQDESEEDENPKSKRRKAPLAISSDSESGSRRKPVHRVKGSDFTESEDDDREQKASKRKKKRETDSDGSGGSSDSGGKKKRRRIKQVDDSEGSESESENEGKRTGRKNIRKVMGKDQLEEATKKAARREKERVARIAERQKLYNNLQFDESGKPDEVVLDKVILDFDPETKEPIIAVDRGLVKKLKPHQANGIKFMWDACFESVKRIKKDKGSGCILAHCMGLGKTLQVVSLTHTLLAHSDLTNVRRVLVVCPLSTVLNWVNEFNMWLKHTESDCEVDIYELSRYKQNSERAWQLTQWFNGGGVCVLGYEMFRNLSADNPKKFRKKMLHSFQQSLVSPGPDLVVCDEGHLLKNEKTSLSQSMNRVKTLRRIVLTGTPLQNNLKEYYCMVQFVKPNLLGKYNEYLNRFVNPITNGQYTDSTEQDIRVMKRRSHVLHKMLDGAVQRRDYGVLAPFLPPKHENVLFITLSDVQIKLYQHYLDNYSRRPMAGRSGFLFPDFQSLQRIWTHPLVLKYNSERYEIMQQKKRDKEEEEDDSEGSLADFIDDDSTPDESSTEESSDNSDASDDSRKKSKKKSKKEKKNKAGARRGTRANPVAVEVDLEVKPPLEAVEEGRNENPTEWWMKLVEEEELEDMRNSHKLILLFDILRQCEAIGDKLLVFSQSLYSLDLIEHFLGKVDEATQEGRIDPKLGNHVGSWSPGIDYFRLDGSTSCENRSLWCKHFNREDNPRARLFLISTRAGGLGINLVAANRVVIFDVSWNPSHDVQSIFRVYRFGQKKPCYVYRFLAMGTMEEKIYERQVTKQAISKRVIDEQQIDRHYAENDLAELYKFEPKPPEPRPLPPLPKDRLFAEMLREHDKEIYKYHEHDSLLENKEEETLTEEERKAAWEDFENEKNRPPPAPFPSVWPMHNGMAPNPLLAQQQQQLAYAAIVAMLRKDMPNVNEAQLRDMLPLIYNSNPAMFGGYDYGLMQKMGEIYKYAPGMMNPMMNPMAGPPMGAMSGASGLQYEPPWQRQQQQQQQMRLQQLLQQQQNSMNAKYYAGGLGSRDPVAMALQQQAAREIMLGDARGRPRGRPPTARPPAPPPDVVNLDSD